MAEPASPRHDPGTGPAFEEVLARYRTRLDDEAAAIRALTSPEAFRRDDYLLAVGEDVARLLVDLVVGRDAKVIVELGTSYGFSTLFLAEAARRTGGRLYTYEIAHHKQEHARSQIADAGLSDVVTWRLGDAVALLADQPGPVDFVLLDLWKDLYIPCFEALHDNLAPGAVVVADNMLVPEASRVDAAAYRAAVRAKADMEAVMLPIGQGIDIAAKRL